MSLLTMANRLLCTILWLVQNQPLNTLHSFRISLVPRSNSFWIGPLWKTSMVHAAQGGYLRTFHPLPQAQGSCGCPWSYSNWGTCWCLWPLLSLRPCECLWSLVLPDGHAIGHAAARDQFDWVAWAVTWGHVNVLSLCYWQGQWWYLWPMLWQKIVLVSIVCSATGDQA